MVLQIGRALGRGSRRALTPVGLVLMGLTLGYILAFTAAVNTVMAAALPPAVRDQAGLGITLPVSPVIAGVVMAVAMLLGMVFFLAATRAFTRAPADRGTVTLDLFTRRIGRALLSAIGANIVVSLSVMIGFALLFVPGLYLSVSFAFVVFAIGVEDARAIDALRRSWTLAKGHRWRLLALVLIVGVGVGLLGSLGSLLTIVDPALSQVVSLVITVPFTVIGYGIIADAYDQVRGEDAEE